MGIRNTASENVVALFDSGTGIAFGPTFEDSDEADAFLQWSDEVYTTDLRNFSGHDWAVAMEEWRPIREELEIRANTLDPNIEYLTMGEWRETHAWRGSDDNGDATPDCDGNNHGHCPVHPEVNLYG